LSSEFQSSGSYVSARDSNRQSSLEIIRVDLRKQDLTFRKTMIWNSFSNRLVSLLGETTRGSAGQA
jgi:hypothetical protein